MANFLGNPENIATGWPGPPKLDAAPIGGLVGEILQQRRYQQALTQKNISDAIKNFQNQREEEAYLKAAQEAGILPQGEAGYGGKYGTALAKLIQDKREAENLAHYRDVMGGAATTRAGGRGGGSGQPGEASGPEFVYDKDGTKYLVVRTSKSVTYHRVPNQAGGGAPKLSPTEKGWAAPEIPGVSVNINAPDQPGTTLQPDVPPMPEPPAQDTTMPPGVKYVPGPSGPQTGGADKNLAPGYGVQGVKMQAPDGTVKTVSPDQVDYYKSRGAVVVP